MILTKARAFHQSPECILNSLIIVGQSSGQTLQIYRSNKNQTDAHFELNFPLKKEKQSNFFTGSNNLRILLFQIYCSFNISFMIYIFLYDGVNQIYSYQCVATLRLLYIFWNTEFLSRFFYKRLFVFYRKIGNGLTSDQLIFFTMIRKRERIIRELNLSVEKLISLTKKNQTNDQTLQKIQSKIVRVIVRLIRIHYVKMCYDV